MIVITEKDKVKCEMLVKLSHKKPPYGWLDVRCINRLALCLPVAQYLLLILLIIRTTWTS